ncbi:stonustoxin subunit beta-like [Megalobrama amblycephala]|uniref:stonustoxin subunit beta-like n=1 Tax=Megalobrama amblycephala TaxID=75352 RepID=UPI002013E018|nr:stonustoxin subunit beta-like [Megalobrama amblycephala]
MTIESVPKIPLNAPSWTRAKGSIGLHYMTSPNFHWIREDICESGGHSVKAVNTHTHIFTVVVLDVSLFLCSDACDLTLDPNTAHTRLVLSDGNNKVTRVNEDQPYPDHPERFDVCDEIPQVLCRERLTGRCYWEAEWSGYGAEISVTYEGINRKGWSEDCVFGENDKSWSLSCSDRRFTVRHNNNRTDIPPVHSSSKRAGVYVDVSAGSLSFYSVSDTHTLTHLHTLNTTFTEPLCAGFRVYSSSVSLCDINRAVVKSTFVESKSSPSPKGSSPSQDRVQRGSSPSQVQVEKVRVQVKSESK